MEGKRDRKRMPYARLDLARLAADTSVDMAGAGGIAGRVVLGHVPGRRRRCVDGASKEAKKKSESRGLHCVRVASTRLTIFGVRELGRS